jgi:Reverse transcriptase (RNA-dependent DNA polymerase)
MEQPYSLVRDQERRKIRQLVRYADFAYCLAIVEDVEFSEPLSYNEMISSKDAADWVVAMNEEVHSLKRNQTWTLVTPSNDKKIVGCKWVFKRKVDGSNSEAFRYKARLVAKGYSQV